MNYTYNINIHRNHIENILYNFGITETCEDIYYGDSLKVAIYKLTEYSGTHNKTPSDWVRMFFIFYDGDLQTILS